MCDFEIFDDKIFVLQRKGNTLKECRILVQDLWINPIDTIYIPKHIEPTEIILDCTENSQLIGNDSVYQLVKKNDVYELMFPAEKVRYNKVMKEVFYFLFRFVMICNILNVSFVSQFGLVYIYC